MVCLLVHIQEQAEMKGRYFALAAKLRAEFFRSGSVTYRASYTDRIPEEIGTNWPGPMARFNSEVRNQRILHNDDSGDDGDQSFADLVDTYVGTL